MLGICLILLFTALIALPGFYIITRKIFPYMSKKKVTGLAVGLTGLLLVILAVSLLSAV